MGWHVEQSKTCQSCDLRDIKMKMKMELKQLKVSAIKRPHIYGAAWHDQEPRLHLQIFKKT